MTDERLTIADLARALFPDMDRSLIQRYDRNPDAQELLGKREGTYPAESLHWWRQIAQARAQKPPLVRPETAGVFLRGVMENPPISDNRLAVIEESSGDELAAPLTDIGSKALSLLESLPEILAELKSLSHLPDTLKAAIPPLADKFLTLREAKEETGLFLWQLKTLPRYDGKVARLDAQNLLRQRKENQR